MCHKAKQFKTTRGSLIRVAVTCGHREVSHTGFFVVQLRWSKIPSGLRRQTPAPRLPVKAHGLEAALARPGTWLVAVVTAWHQERWGVRQWRWEQQLPGSTDDRPQNEESRCGNQ